MRAIWQILSQDERLVLIFAYVLETRDLFRTLYETNLTLILLHISL